jgi:hypothetical protein
MRKYFKAINEKAADGWMLGFTSGNSGIDNEDWVIDTNSLHADQIPEACSDAKLFSQLVAGLLNCYYNNLETKGLSEEQIIELGIVTEEQSIPSAKNTELPF